MIASTCSIPLDRMVVVTGDPRSGTSLMMQTLRLLGVPVTGSPFPREDRPLAADEDPFEHQRRIERARHLNPRGFYEIPGVVMRGTRRLSIFGGKAIKIVSAGAYPRRRRGREFGTPPELVHRYILCLRDPRQVAESQRTLRRGGNTQADATRFALRNGGLMSWLARQSDQLRARWLVVDYDTFLDSPAATIERVVRHLNWPGRRRAAAIANVDPALRRANPSRERSPSSTAADDMARRVYAALQSFDLSAMRQAADELATWRRQLRFALASLCNS